MRLRRELAWSAIEFQGAVTYIPRGKAATMRPCTKTFVRMRLHLIEEQVRDTATLIEAEGSCGEILRLMVAARAALETVEREVVWDYIAQCVERAVVVGDRTAEQAEIDEIINALDRVMR